MHTPAIVIMGPSGSGKSTVGQALAHELSARYIDADDLHTKENVAKMASGIALVDSDRWPWLQRVGEVLRAESPTIVACSALKRAYRETIRMAAGGDVFFVELVVEREILDYRLRQRAGHYMPPSLLESQLQILEPLGDDEDGIRVDADDPVHTICRLALDALAQPARHS